MSETTTRTFRVNGEERTVAFPTHHTLLEVLREELGLTGTKHGCELGECGTCTVLVDGRPQLSCLLLAAEVDERAIETVEGLQEGNRLHPLQETFADLGAEQAPGTYSAPRNFVESVTSDDKRLAPILARRRSLNGDLTSRSSPWKPVIRVVPAPTLPEDEVRSLDRRSGQPAPGADPRYGSPCQSPPWILGR